jgi:hypothetical protein
VREVEALEVLEVLVAAMVVAVMVVAAMARAGPLSECMCTSCTRHLRPGT